MVNNKIFVISDELFSGYSLEIDMDKMNNKIDIINEIVDSLRNEFKKLKLESLGIKLLKCNFHIHNYDFEDIIKSKYNQKFWVCNHKHHK
jgi:hypothetical protein